MDLEVPRLLFLTDMEVQNLSVSLQTMGYLKRADPSQLRAVFEKYASAKVEGESFMTDEDFVVKFLQLFPAANFDKHSVKLLCGIIDQSKDG